MKKIIAMMILVLAGVVGASAQEPTATSSQSANEGFVGYQFTATKFDVNQPTYVAEGTRKTYGVNAAYTRYFGGSATKAGVVGLTGDASVGFADGNVSLVSGLVGVTAKARNNKHAQPYVRVLGGVARQTIRPSGVIEVSDTSAAFAVGAGLDANITRYSRYKLRFGVDYLNTGFAGERQNGYRITTGLVF